MSKSEFTGTFTDMDEIVAKMKAASEDCHIIGIQVGAQPPPAHGVALTMIYVEAGPDTYKVEGGMLGLKARVFDEIASAMGISWDPSLSGRRDDRRHPHFIEYLAVGYFRGCDGTRQWTKGGKRLDLREGSDDVALMHANSKDGDATAQIRQKRRFILELAETGANARATKKVSGVRTYTPSELDRPFCVAKLVFTGRTPGNPELEDKMTLMAASAAIGASAALYGAAPAPAAPASAASDGGMPDFEDLDNFEDFEDDDGPGYGPGYESQPAPPARREPAPERQSGRYGEPERQPERQPEHRKRPTAARKRPTEGADPSMVIRFGRAKGETIGDASSENLEFLEMVTAKGVADPSKSRWRDDNVTLLAALRAELSRRGASDAA